MNDASPLTGFECPINLFRPQQARITALTCAIQTARDRKEQILRAVELIAGAQPLLRCQSFEKSSLSCVYCRSFAELRLRTASQIVRSDQALTSVPA